MSNRTLLESTMGSLGARFVVGGALAVLGLIVLKFIIGLLGAIMGLFMFVLTTVVPIVLIGLVVVWIFRKLTRKQPSVTTP
jgi:hypothetical protein